MGLDLSSLEKAVHSLDRALTIASESGAVSADHAEVLRAGVIQNFEFTYELCWKFMKRWLEHNGEGAQIDGATRKELFRIAAERRLIAAVESWFRYTHARNETAHTYDPATAAIVYEAARDFLKDAQYLLARLKEKND